MYGPLGGIMLGKLIKLIMKWLKNKLNDVSTGESFALFFPNVV